MASPQQIALILWRKAQALDRAVRAAEAASADDALAIARELSSGTRTPAQLRAAGHPYRLGGSGPALPVNIRTGRFLAGWKVTGPRKSGDGLKTTLLNTDRKARLLQRGTGRMMARPVIERVRMRIKLSRMKRHRAALKAVHGG